MTERGRPALRQELGRFQVGPSHMQWDGDELVVEVDEITVPIPRKLRGTIRLSPAAFQPRWFALDGPQRHHWWPYAPSGRISVDFKDPDLHWTGHGYADCNAGTAALEADFSAWNWMRLTTPTGAALFYAPQERSGARSLLAFDVSHDGEITARDAPKEASVKNGIWGVGRNLWSEGPAQLDAAMEDAPFYTRNAVSTQLDGAWVSGVHETLDLDRFSKQWVRLLLPFRMPRRRHWSW